MDPRDRHGRQGEIPPDYPEESRYSQTVQNGGRYQGDQYNRQSHDPYTQQQSQSQYNQHAGYQQSQYDQNVPNAGYQQSQDPYSHPESQFDNRFDNARNGDPRVVDPEDVIPTYKKKDSGKSPKGTLIRHRLRSRKRGDTWDEPDYDDDENDDDILPSQRRQKRSRTKSMKERRDELQENKESIKRRPLTLTERYAELRQGNAINPRNLADIVKDSTLTRMNKLGIGGGESKTVHQFKLGLRQFRDRFTIWSGTLKEVEGKYGTAVMTYFRFIKWLMFLNIYIMIIMFCVITVPYLAIGPRTFNESLEISNPNVTGYDEAISCTSQYDTYHQAVEDNETLALKVLDFVQGTGWMERTVMFYGVYYNKTYKSAINDDKETIYNMGLAYMLAVGGSFLLSFVLVVKNAGKNVKVTIGREDAYAKHCNKIFAGWDYCICAPKNAITKQRTITIDIKADLNEQRKVWKDADMDMADKIKLFIKRLFINFIVICLLGGALYLIIFTAEEMIKVQQNELEAIIEFLVQYVPFLTITVLNLVLPIVFQKIVKFEEYTYNTEIKITLARSILLRLASPIALIGILYSQLIETVSDDKRDHSEIICGNKQWASTSGRGSIRCWEVYFGQQLYKLVLLDFFIEAGIIFFVQTPRWFLYNRYGSKSKLINFVGPQEFDLPQSVVDIIYTQILCWLGLFFSPLIPFMTFIKCVLFFWVKRFAAITVSVPQDRPFKTSRSNSLFMLVLLLAFVIAAVPIGYMVGNIQPSQSCGPFRVYNSTADAVMFDVITHTVNSWPIEARDIFQYLGTVGFFIPVFFLLGIVMYYYWLLGQGYKKTAKILQNQLKLEGRDKKYLLARVNEVLESTEVNQNSIELFAAS